MLFAVEMPLVSVAAVPIFLALMLVYMWLDARMIRRLNKQLTYEINARSLIAGQYSGTLSKIRKERNDSARALGEASKALEESKSQLNQAIKDRDDAVMQHDVLRAECDTLQRLLDEAKNRFIRATKERNEAKANFNQAVQDLHQQKEASRKQREAYEAAANERCEQYRDSAIKAIKERDEAIRAAEQTQAYQYKIDQESQAAKSELAELKDRINDIVLQSAKAGQERDQVRANFLTLLCDHGEAYRIIGELSHYVREMKKLACLAEERLPQQDHETPATLPDDPITAEAPPSAADDFFDQYVATVDDVTECPWSHNPNITIVRRKKDGVIVGLRGMPTSAEMEILTKMIDDEEKARQRIVPGQDSNPC